MRVLKVVLEGITTSFRYPHFMMGVQPSFPMPPPATIYGHICSALGEWIDPKGLAFAYHFTAQEALWIWNIFTFFPCQLENCKGHNIPRYLKGT